MTELDKKLIEASSAQDVERGSSGLWTVKKLPIVGPEPFDLKTIDGRRVLLPPGVYTSLFCLTESTMLKGGELVMHDFPGELNKHLHFMRQARGDVLITGLGLGCVARGCLANPRVDTVTVIEKSEDVLKLVAPYMPIKGSNLPPALGGPRLNIIHDDAVVWCRKNTQRFDCAWHDLWVPQEDDPHLQQLHMRMICALWETVEFQGAWEFPREFRRIMEKVI